MTSVFGAEFRKIENREYLGKAALVAVAVRTYDTTVEDLWEAITTPERLARWFTSVEGDLKVGGRYQLKGNASGTITRCEQPQALELTWEFMGGTSWVNVQLEAVGDRARLTIEHIAHTDGIGEEHMKRFGGNGAGGHLMKAGPLISGLRSDGEEFPIEASISHTTEGGQRFFTVILRDVTERVRAEQALKATQAEVQSLALAASTAREQEKSRIARELHDELGQALTALKIDVGWLREHIPAASEEAKKKLSAMQVLLDGTVAAARRISSDLRPLMLDDLGLTAAADWLAHNFTNRTGVPCELVIGAGDLDLADPHATAVFRVLQESLTNVAKHADATQVEATLERTEDEVVLTVRDNGRGFSVEAPRKQGSFGLTGLRERAFLLGGDVRLESAPGQGTTVEMRIPVKDLP